MTVSVLAASGQSQYVSTFDYRTPALAPVGFVPGVHWLLGDNSTYDANHQRLFFQGSSVDSPPWSLYTFDVVAGTVVASPTILPNNPRGQLLGLQYDNSVDSLFALYVDGAGGLFFVSVDAGSGLLTTRSSLSGFAGYSGSTYDVRDRRYIFYGGGYLGTVDARTGEETNYEEFANPNMDDLVYDNTNNTLYGISVPASGVASLNSIDIASAALTHLVDLPVRNFLALNTYTIDEAAGNYLFVGDLPVASGCVNYQFYSVALSLGAVNYSSLYPYAQDATNPLDSNLVEWSFDQVRGKLYAMNWRPTTSTVTPYFTITGANPTCPGQPDVFTATLSAPLTANGYEWQVNGVDAGGPDAAVFSDGAPLDGDKVFCILTATSACGTVIKDTSNTISLTVGDTAFVHVAVSGPDSVCAGSPATFTAVVGNGGAAPVYQWMVDGLPAGGGGPAFTYSPSPGDGVSVRVTGDAACIDPTPAVSVVVTPVVVPVTTASLTIAASADDICSGDMVVFTASPSEGGVAPVYQWMVDGVSAGSGGATFSTTSLADGDVVSCVLTSSMVCTPAVPASDPVTMVVRERPGLVMPGDTVMARGSVDALLPVVTVASAASGGVVGYEWTPAAGLSNAFIGAPLASPLYTTTYTLTVLGADGCNDSGKVTIRIFTPLSMPSAFTPNGDGLNDVFRIPPTLSIVFSRLSVYDRWGQRLFMTTDVSSGWDGMVGGHASPAGAYVWVVEYADAVTGKALVAKGTVLLVR